jgi:acyl carrier protein
VTDPAFEASILALVAETFDADPRTIGRDTTADDVDGWDSLGHAVLLARIGKKFGLEIGEEIAMEPRNVGELVDRLATASGRT